MPSAVVGNTFLSVLLALLAPRRAFAASLKSDNTPVAKVVELLESLRGKIESDGALEEDSSDKFQCWAANTLKRTAAGIEAGESEAAELQTQIVKLKGELGVHGAEIKQLKKLIAANLRSQSDATEARQKQAGEYESEKLETEQCVGAVEAAIKVLSGAGAKKAGFLGTLQEAKLLTVVAGIRGVLIKRDRLHSISNEDLELVKDFTSRPEDFIRESGKVMSAAQIGQNPFGDYAPQSTQIQGILKSMYDSFTSGLEADNAEEARAVKAFKELMLTLQQEQKALEKSLETEVLNDATKQETLTDARTQLDDTNNQLAADKELFGATKESSRRKAYEWSSRQRLRSEELTGIRNAIKILTSPQATKTFENAFNESNAAAASFLQLAPSRRSTISYAQLLGHSSTARRTAILAEIAAAMKTSGHFDKVIAMIDNMISLLRREEQDDIAHRDRCQAGLSKNTNDKEDMASDIRKATRAIVVMENTETKLNADINQTNDDISALEQSMAERLNLRNDEHTEFTNALSSDADAIMLIDRAIASLTKFYTNNQINIKLVQRALRNYTKDDNTAPDTVFRGGDYGGRKSESFGIISILSMLKEDLEKGMKEGRQDNAEAEANYEKEKASQEHDLRALKATLADIQLSLAELLEKKDRTELYNGRKWSDLDAETRMTDALDVDCNWVSLHFDSRRAKRKAEIGGLQDAKESLAGVDFLANP